MLHQAHDLDDELDFDYCLDRLPPPLSPIQAVVITKEVKNSNKIRTPSQPWMTSHGKRIQNLESLLELDNLISAMDKVEWVDIYFAYFRIKRNITYIMN